MSQVISKDGTAISFNRSGKGEPIILVDGALCSRSFGPMPKLARLLSTNFAVITYDRRGRGESGDALSYAVQREIEDIEALIAAAGGSAHLPPEHSESQLRRLVAEGRSSDAVKFFIVDIARMPAISIWIMRMLPIWRKLKAVAHTLPCDAAILGDFSVSSKATAAVKAPALVIGGERSPVELRRAVSAVADAVPGSTRQMLKDQTHNVSVKVLAPALMEFFVADNADFSKSVDFADSQATRK